MQRKREFNAQRLYGMNFVAVVAAIILFINSIYVCVIWFPKLAQGSGIALLVMFLYHIIFVNLVLAFYQSIVTDPGLVPPNWGFYMGDETKRRRYCKMCNVWKPDRTHHCSICNRCILNMDHHCPWINNCVGFYNRKFFMQLLGHAYLILLFILLTSVWECVSRLLICGNLDLRPVGETKVAYVLTSAFVFSMFMMSFFFVCMLTNFFKFHLKLVLDNYTTIENLEREEGAKSKFDIGRRRNWEQVFGNAQALWWLPFHTNQSRPIGDGVRWRVHYTRVIDEDEETPA